MTTAPSPILFFSTINAYQNTAALRSAIELDLFTAIGATPATVPEIAARCGCPERGIRILADTMVVLGFLTKEGDRYAQTLDTATFLDRKSPAYLGGSVEFFDASGLKDGFNHLTDTIRRGRKADAGTTEPDASVWVRFARVMAPLMFLPANGAAEVVKLDAGRATRILDISASHGVYGITFAQRYPLAHLVALDWAPVLEATTENARMAGLEGRFSTIAGNAFSADFGSDYDLILVPNFLHHFSWRECVDFLRRAFAALRTGGVVAIVEFVPNEDRVSPPAAAGFSLVMLGTTPEGEAYTFEDYRKMLVEAGFAGAEFHPLPPTAQSLVVARK